MLEGSEQAVRRVYSRALASTTTEEAEELLQRLLASEVFCTPGYVPSAKAMRLHSLALQNLATIRENQDRLQECLRLLHQATASECPSTYQRSGSRGGLRMEDVRAGAPSNAFVAVNAVELRKRNGGAEEEDTSSEEETEDEQEDSDPRTHSDAQLWERMAHVALRVGQLATARTALERALQATRHSAVHKERLRLLQQLMELVFGLGDLHACARLAREYLSTAPGNPQALLLLARCEECQQGGAECRRVLMRTKRRHAISDDSFSHCIRRMAKLRKTVRESRNRRSNEQDDDDTEAVSLPLPARRPSWPSLCQTVLHVCEGHSTSILVDARAWLQEAHRDEDESQSSVTANDDNEEEEEEKHQIRDDDEWSSTRDQFLHSLSLHPCPVSHASPQLPSLLPFLQSCGGTPLTLLRLVEELLRHVAKNGVRLSVYLLTRLLDLVDVHAWQACAEAYLYMAEACMSVGRRSTCTVLCALAAGTSSRFNDNQRCRLQWLLAQKYLSNTASPHALRHLRQCLALLPDVGLAVPHSGWRLTRAHVSQRVSRVVGTATEQYARELSQDQQHYAVVQLLVPLLSAPTEQRSSTLLSMLAEACEECLARFRRHMDAKLVRTSLLGARVMLLRVSKDMGKRGDTALLACHTALMQWGECHPMLTALDETLDWRNEMMEASVWCLSLAGLSTDARAAAVHLLCVALCLSRDAHTDSDTLQVLRSGHACLAGIKACGANQAAFVRDMACVLDSARLVDVFQGHEKERLQELGQCFYCAHGVGLSTFEHHPREHHRNLPVPLTIRDVTRVLDYAVRFSSLHHQEQQRRGVVHTVAECGVSSGCGEVLNFDQCLHHLLSAAEPLVRLPPVSPAVEDVLAGRRTQPPEDAQCGSSDAARLCGLFTKLLATGVALDEVGSVRKKTNVDKFLHLVRHDLTCCPRRLSSWFWLGWYHLQGEPDSSCVLTWDATSSSLEQFKLVAHNLRRSRRCWEMVRWLLDNVDASVLSDCDESAQLVPKPTLLVHVSEIMCTLSMRVLEWHCMLADCRSHPLARMLEECFPHQQEQQDALTHIQQLMDMNCGDDAWLYQLMHARMLHITNHPPKDCLRAYAHVSAQSVDALCELQLARWNMLSSVCKTGVSGVAQVYRFLLEDGLRYDKSLQVPSDATEEITLQLVLGDIRDAFDDCVKRDASIYRAASGLCEVHLFMHRRGLPADLAHCLSLLQPVKQLVVAKNVPGCAPHYVLSRDSPAWQRWRSLQRTAPWQMRTDLCQCAIASFHLKLKTGDVAGFLVDFAVMQSASPQMQGKLAIGYARAISEFYIGLLSADAVRVPEEAIVERLLVKAAETSLVLDKCTVGGERDLRDWLLVLPFRLSGHIQRLQGLTTHVFSPSHPITPAELATAKHWFNGRRSMRQLVKSNPEFFS